MSEDPDKPSPIERAVDVTPETRIAELEAEIARLRPIEAAAREAVAFWQGRRPGFAASYPQELLQAALGTPTKGRPAPRRTRRPSK